MRVVLLFIMIKFWLPTGGCRWIVARCCLTSRFPCPFFGFLPPPPLNPLLQCPRCRLANLRMRLARVSA
eukprot:6172387-Pleurochrysis_carterae.AAC.1